MPTGSGVARALSLKLAFLFGATQFVLSDASAAYSSCEVSLPQFEKLSVGMTYSEVASTLRCDGKIMEVADMGHADRYFVYWQGNAGVESILVGEFELGELVGKSQKRLK